MTSLTAVSEQEWVALSNARRAESIADAVAWCILSSVSVLHACWYFFLAWTLGGIG